MKRTKSPNPNQRSGPRVGNAGTQAKRDSFLAEKSDRSSHYSALADMVTSALEARGRGMRTERLAEAEPLAPVVNVGRRRK